MQELVDGLDNPSFVGTNIKQLNIHQHLGIIVAIGHMGDTSLSSGSNATLHGSAGCNNRFLA